MLRKMAPARIGFLQILLVFAVLIAFEGLAGATTISLGTTADFALLALDNGSLSINSATSIIGDVGYSKNVAVPSAQKVDTFTGTAYVYSGATTTNFNGSYVPATFAPSGGIQYGPGAVDTKLDQANTDALNLQTTLNGLFTAGPVTNLGTLNSNTPLTGGGGINLYDVTSMDFNSNTLTLTGGSNDWFVFRVAGIGNGWSQSNTVLNGVDPNHVLFYFTSTDLSHDAITVNKDNTVFDGTIFAPNGQVEYHNPGTFDGRIVAENIIVHSDFNIESPPSPPEVPEPSSLLLLGSAVAGLGGITWRRNRRK